MDDVAQRDDGESAANDADGEQDEEDSRDVQGEALLDGVRALRNGPGSSRGRVRF